MKHPLIELAPHTSGTLGRCLSRLLGCVLVALGLLVIVRVGVAIYLGCTFAERADVLARATGASAPIAAWLTGTFSWTLAFAFTSLVLSLATRALLPFSGVSPWRSAALVLVVSGLGVCVPEAIRNARGLDADFLPATMREILDPSKVVWFPPSSTGASLVFISEEPDGRIRYWDRPGRTPDRGIGVRAATTADRLHFDQRRSAEDRQRAAAAAAEARKQAESREAARLAAERVAAERTEAERREAARLAAERVAERKLAEKREADRLAAEKAMAEQKRLESLERSERERLAQEKLENERRLAVQAESMRRAGAPRLRYALEPRRWTRVPTYGGIIGVRADVPVEAMAGNSICLLEARQGLRFNRDRNGRVPEVILIRPRTTSAGVVEVASFP